jgi:SAM-dependent methyltransferase
MDAQLRKQLERLQILAHEKTHQKALSLFRSFSPRGRLLEVPAGEGALAWRLAEMGYEVVGGDVDPDFFKVPYLRCLRLDMNDIFPIEDETFSYISCIEGLEHLENQFSFVRECRRILRPGGKLVLSTPNILNIASRMKYLLSGFYSLFPRPLNEFNLIPVFDHIHPVSYYQLRYLLHTNGFKITSITTDLIRRSAVGLFFLYPFARFAMLRTMRKETDLRQQQANREIRRVMASGKIFFGRTLIVVAEKIQEGEHPPVTTLASEMPSRPDL